MDAPSQRGAQPPGKSAIHAGRPESDLRLVAEHHGNICTVLTGFAFTAVILIVQQPPTASGLPSRAIASFLIAFFGCLLAALNYGVITGDLKLSPRPRGAFLLTGVTTIVSSMHIFFGLSYLVAAYLADLLYLSKTLFILGALFSCGSTLNVEIGLARFYDAAPYTPRSILRLVAPSFVMIACAGVLSLAQWVYPPVVIAVGYPVTVALSVLVIMASSVLTLFVHAQQEDYRLPTKVAAGSVFAAAALFSLMILMT